MHKIMEGSGTGVKVEDQLKTSMKKKNFDDRFERISGSPNMKIDNSVR